MNKVYNYVLIAILVLSVIYIGYNMIKSNVDKGAIFYSSPTPTPTAGCTKDSQCGSVCGVCNIRTGHCWDNSKKCAWCQYCEKDVCKMCDSEMCPGIRYDTCEGTNPPCGCDLSTSVCGRNNLGRLMCCGKLAYCGQFTCGCGNGYICEYSDLLREYTCVKDGDIRT